jgi:hypothetical protein
MLKFLATLTVFLTLPAYSAGLGFNPFEKNSPTSATKPSKPSPSSPAPVSSPAPKPAPTPAPQQSTHQPAKPSTQGK